MLRWMKWIKRPFQRLQKPASRSAPSRTIRTLHRYHRSRLGQASEPDRLDYLYSRSLPGSWRGRSYSPRAARRGRPLFSRRLHRPVRLRPPRQFGQMGLQQIARRLCRILCAGKPPVRPSGPQGSRPAINLVRPCSRDRRRHAHSIRPALEKPQHAPAGTPGTF